MHHVNVTANEVDDKESFSDSRLQIDSDSEDDEFWLWLQSDLKSDDKFGLNDGIIFLLNQPIFNLYGRVFNVFQSKLTYFW